MTTGSQINTKPAVGNRCSSMLATVSLMMFFSGLVAGCDDRPADPSAKPSNQSAAAADSSVFASNATVGFFARSLLGPDVVVACPGTDVTNPRQWRPDDQAITQMQQADMVLLIGAGYETWLPWVSLSPSNQVELSHSLHRQVISVEGVTHQHGPGGKPHSHREVATHFWLDPGLAMELVDAMAQALADKFPELADAIRRRQSALKAKFEKLEERSSDIIPESIDSHERPTVFSTDSRFAYLNRWLGFNETILHWTDHGDAELPNDAWKKFDEAAQLHQPFFVWFPATPSQSMQNELKKRGLSWRICDGLDSAGDAYFERFSDLLESLKS